MPEKDVYWYWYAFMQRSKKAGYEWTGAAKKYFGDPDVSFEEWWTTHQKLFWKPDPYTFRELSTLADFEDFEPEMDLRICISLLAPKEKILKDVGSLISERTKGKPTEKKRGWPGFDDWSDYIQLYQRPNLPSLERTLRILDLYEVQKPNRLNQIAMAREARLFSKEGFEEMSIESIKSTVSRYKKWGDKIMENVAKGVFPKHD